MLILPVRLSSDVRDLGREIDLAIELAEDPHASRATAVTVSHWSVQDHLEHLLRADTGILQWVHGALGSSGVGAGGPTGTGRLVLTLGFIPRGKGKAPEGTTPVSTEIPAIVEGLARVRTLARQLSDRVPELRSAGATREHPVLGHFNAAQWVRFARIHHRHHRRIIADIVAQVPS